MAILSLDGVSRQFTAHGTRVKALDGVSFSVSRGEVISIIGSSGSGKSTLLRSINGLEKIDSGRIVIDSDDVSVSGEWKHRRRHRKAIRSARQKTGMIFQHFNLFPHMTVLENVTEAPLTVRKIPQQQARESARDILARVGLADRMHYYPNRLSGGERQRVAIARALGMEPAILLCDEPTSALDPELIGEVLDVLRTLAEKHMTMLIVTHEIRFAREISDRIIFMDKGRILEQGSPEKIFENPDHPRIREFISKML